MSIGPAIEVRNLVKNYGALTALNDISMDFREGEFFALLGPSGCGKTTLLRALAGFVEPTSGSILLDGKDLTSMPPNKRPINMMFQSYALFPHMTVMQNIRYGLELAGIAKQEIATRVAAIMAATHLTSLGERLPSHLSGGQRQRVALARALVIKPRVLLLDEPLGALDKKLREAMQLELKHLQHEFAITFIVVTHDQEEALVMADRIALMRNGRIEQIGTAVELYERPQSRFVADFIGSANLIEGTAAGSRVETQELGTVLGPADAAASGKVVYSIRPERIVVGTEPSSQGLNSFRGAVSDIAYHGPDRHLHMRVNGAAKPIVVRVSANDRLAQGLEAGSEIWISWDPADARILER